MNLETFKARARRKLALPGHNSVPSAVAKQSELESTPPASISMRTSTPAYETPEAALDTQHDIEFETPEQASPDTSSDSASDPSTGIDRFAMAMSEAARMDSRTTSNNDTYNEIRRWPGSEETEAKPAPTTFQSLTGSASSQPTSSEAQLAHLRSLLIGNEQKSRQDQVEDVYQRTQSDLNQLRHDMDTRLTELSNYVAQIEGSLRSNVDTKTTEFSDQSAQMLTHHDQRLDALDARITDMLKTARSELGERRAANRDQLETKLAAITDHGDRQLQAVSERLEASIAQMQSKISAQLSQQSTTALPGADIDISNLRATLETAIDERVRSVNEEQTSGMRKLRDVMLAHTDSLKAELQAQTQAQNAQLATHREEMESQFNSALTTLNDNKVSHQELSQLLSRLADRIQRL